jgi:hypothetical protein
MKNFIFNINTWCAFILSVMLLPSCQDELDKHFKDESNKASKTRIADYIRSVFELSKFSQMLAISGYDTILNASQTYTVWAPDNEALQNIDLNDTALVAEIVKNHVSKYSYAMSASLPEGLKIRMINGKRNNFTRDESGIHFESRTITTGNILLANGIVHMIDGYVPYKNNIWEYIERTSGMDSLRSYIISQRKRVFDPANSTVLGVDSLGNTVYDSVMIERNVLLDQIGTFYSEDSVYTTILPDNTAWKEAYNRVKTYFVSNSKTQATSIQRDSTCFAMLRDMVFRALVVNPSVPDSLVSTTGNVFHQPVSLFNGATRKEASNGFIYITSQLPFKATDSWHRKIQVEAEISTGRTNSNSNIYLYNSYGSLFDVSRKEYIVVDPTTTSSISRVYVDFSIPHPQSARYNIYCVFVPGSIANANNMLPYRVSFFFLTHLAMDRWTAQQFSVSNNVSNPAGITKMLIAQDFKFPYFDADLEEKTIAYYGIRVQNEVGSTETGFSRTMRIDYIILEPVSQ